MPKYFVPTGLIVEAVDPIQAQAFAYGLLQDVTTAEVDFAEETFCAEDCECQEACAKGALVDYWTYDYDDKEHPVELLAAFAGGLK